jgi:hypothetical protein
MCQHVCVDLPDSIHGHADHDQQAGSAKIEWYGEFRYQDFRQDADDRQVGLALPLVL